MSCVRLNPGSHSLCVCSVRVFLKKKKNRHALHPFAQCCAQWESILIGHRLGTGYWLVILFMQCFSSSCYGFHISRPSYPFLNLIVASQLQNSSAFTSYRSLFFFFLNAMVTRFLHQYESLFTIASGTLFTNIFLFFIF